MTLFMIMLPFYIFGNLHCLGMCGPLTMMLASHPWRYAYFFGRLVSFSLAGLAAGGAGAVVAVMFDHYHLAAITSLLFGGVIVAVGFSMLTGLQIGSARILASATAPLVALPLKEGAAPIFLFGFLTLFLPCGQTLIVFSACALNGSALAGLANGCAFALLTSPSLLLAMHAIGWVQRHKHLSNQILGACALIVGTLAICRGLADAGIISHCVLNNDYHIVLF